MAMFKQVVSKTFAMSIIVAASVTCYLSMPKLKALDLYAGITYIKAHTLEWRYKNRIVLHENAYKKIPKVDAYDKYGLYQKSADTRKIIKHPKFKGAYEKIEEFILDSLLVVALITPVSTVLVFFVWSRFGSIAKAKKHLTGHKVKTAQEVVQYLRKHKIASSFKIGEVPLVKDSEVKHILITGSTGSGKTNALHLLLPQIRAQKQPAVILDTEVW